jgi:peptidoglycan/LPS O-acetylase OafA/YrhL
VPESKPASLFFRGLNGVRFFAALVVIIHHVEQFKSVGGLENLYYNPLVMGLGDSGVSLFFVLSGFLITSLLLEERRKTGGIAIKHFYLRRVLRIWPLYFLIVGWSFFLLPLVPHYGIFADGLSQDVGSKLAWFLVVLPNVALAFFPPVLGASQTWSIGVEEQFYLVWPVLLRRFVRKLPVVLIGVIVLKLGAVVTAHLLLPRILPAQAYALTEVVDTFRIEAMAFGALAAWLLFSGRVSSKNLVFHPVSCFIVLGLMIGMDALEPRVPVQVIKTVVYAVFIAQVVTNTRAWRVLDNRVVSYFGTVSYGIYMFHTSVIAFVMALVGGFVGLPVVYNVLVYTLSIGGTLLVSALSYRFVESRFLALKGRLTGSKTRVAHPRPVEPHLATVAAD